MPTWEWSVEALAPLRKTAPSTARRSPIALTAVQPTSQLCHALHVRLRAMRRGPACRLGQRARGWAARPTIGFVNGFAVVAVVTCRARSSQDRSAPEEMLDHG